MKHQGHIKDDPAAGINIKSGGRYEDDESEVHCIAMKDVGLRIRVQRDLREQFLKVCRAQDKPAAQVLREFMRGYVTQHQSAHTTREPSPKLRRGSAGP